MKKIYSLLIGLMLTIAAQAQTLNVVAGGVTYQFPASQAGEQGELYPFRDFAGEHRGCQRLHAHAVRKPSEPVSLRQVRCQCRNVHPSHASAVCVLGPAADSLHCRSDQESEGKHHFHDS